MLEKHSVKIGDKLRFIDNHNLYVGIPQVRLPKLGEIYEVRGFSIKGFYLVEIVNPWMPWFDNHGKFLEYDEPGFGAWRFERPIPRMIGKTLYWSDELVRKTQKKNLV